jgi:VanZ family protein
MVLQELKKMVQLSAKYCWYISALLLAIITLLSLVPLPEFPGPKGSDKAHHLIAYVALSFPVAARGGARWLVILPFFILWGGLIELLQPYVNRHAEWLDFAVNSLGVGLGALLGMLARRL